MNTSDYNTLLASLGQAVEILDRHRTPDPEFVVAYDTLKQSRALIQQIAAQLQPNPNGKVVELAA